MGESAGDHASFDEDDSPSHAWWTFALDVQIDPANRLSFVVAEKLGAKGIESAGFVDHGDLTLPDDDLRPQGFAGSVEGAPS
jgi:hypothetical protein